MTGVISLGYVGFDVTDRHAWRKFMSDVIGLMLQPASAQRETDYYKIDAYHHRISVMQAKQNRLSHIGWEVTNADAFRQLTIRLREAGITVEEAGQKTCADRRVTEMSRISGPDGVTHEIFHTPITDDMAFVSEHVKDGFKTGDQGFGHVVLAAQEPSKAAEWYQRMLGFKLSDRIDWDDITATFLHCNRRHHSLALLNCVMGMKPGDLNHILLEMNSLDDVGRAYDRVHKTGVPLALTLGKHSNDHMISFYIVNPSGSAIEIGCGGLAVDDAVWQPRHYDTPKIWGHFPAHGGKAVV